MELIARFHPLQQGDEYEHLMALKYQESFEAISTTFKGAVNEVLTGAFKNGLKEVCAELRMQKSSSLFKLIELAQRVEERNNMVETSQKLYPGCPILHSPKKLQ